jgi:hypothetical protein
MPYSLADYCSIAGLPFGVIAVALAVCQSRRAASEAAERGRLAGEAHRFLVALKPSVQAIPGVTAAIDDQLARLAPSLK